MCAFYRSKGEYGVNGKGTKGFIFRGKYLFFLFYLCSMILGNPRLGMAELAAPTWMPSFPLIAGPQVILMWTPVPGAGTYKVYQNGKVVAEGVVGFQTTVPTPQKGGEYSFQVVAVDSQGKEGKLSNAGKIRVVAVMPPKGLTSLASETKISLRWDGSPSAVIYDLYRRKKEEKEFSLLSSLQDTRYTDTSVSPKVLYVYAVKSRDLTGKASDFSEEITASLRIDEKAKGEKVYSLVPYPTRRVAVNNLVDYNPSDVAAFVDGRVLVSADVLILFPEGIKEGVTGELLFRGKQGFGGVGAGNNGELLATHNDGNIYVFDPSGDNVIRTMQIPHPQPGQLKYGMSDRPNNPFVRNNKPLPRDVAQDRQGYYYVVDASNYRLVKFSPEGEFLATVAYEKNKEDWLITTPSFLAIDQEGNKFVTGTVYVTVFDKDDRQAGTVGNVGSGVGSFGAPSGLAVDRKGNLLVGDIRANNIQGFRYSPGDKVWEPAFALSSPDGKGSIELAYPTGIAVTPDGKRLVAAESMAHKVAVFELIEQ